MKLCKDCVYSKFSYSEALALCNHPEAPYTTNVVNGVLNFNSCQDTRAGKCGIEDPKLHKPRPEGLIRSFLERLWK